MILTNQLRKYVKSLYLTKFRQKYNKFVAEGPKICTEIIQNRPKDIEYIFCTEEWIQSHASEFNKLSGKTIICKDKDLQSISNLDTANNILIVLNKNITEFNNSILKDNWAIYLDDIRDPGNMGTIIRIADWYNIKFLISSPDSVDYYNPKVVQSAMGSHNRVKLIVTNIVHADVSGLKLYSLTMHGEELTSGISLKPGILVIGNESKGVSSEVTNLSTKCLTIPRLGGAESLNASVACGIACNLLIK